MGKVNFDRETIDKRVGDVVSRLNRGDVVIIKYTNKGREYIAGNRQPELILGGIEAIPNYDISQGFRVMNDPMMRYFESKEIETRGAGFDRIKSICDGNMRTLYLKNLPSQDVK
jgi:hypothetical protein